MAVPNSTLALATSSRWAERRKQRAVGVLGEEVVERILAFSWYLQGAEAQEIASALDMSADTLNGLFKRVLRDGLPALEDRRHSSSAFLPPDQVPEKKTSAQLHVDSEQIVLSVGSVRLELKRSDALLCRTVLFMVLETGNLTIEILADALKLSVERVRKLRAQFRRKGAAALLDRRQGQTQDYAMPAAVKAELIRQYVERLEMGQPVTAPALKAAIEAAGKSSPSPQTLRVHIRKSGLAHIHADTSQPERLKKGLLTS